MTGHCLQTVFARAMRLVRADSRSRSGGKNHAASVPRQAASCCQFHRAGAALGRPRRGDGLLPHCGTDSNPLI